MGDWTSRAMVARYAHLADESLREGAATVVSKTHYVTWPA